MPLLASVTLAGIRVSHDDEAVEEDEFVRSILLLVCLLSTVGNGTARTIGRWHTGRLLPRPGRDRAPAPPGLGHEPGDRQLGPARGFPPILRVHRRCRRRPRLLDLPLGRDALLRPADPGEP